jgi:hypothetical protein
LLQYCTIFSSKQDAQKNRKDTANPKEKSLKVETGKSMHAGVRKKEILNSYNLQKLNPNLLYIMQYTRMVGLVIKHLGCFLKGEGSSPRRCFSLFQKD